MEQKGEKNATFIYVEFMNHFGYLMSIVKVSPLIEHDLYIPR